ncbi:NAD(P)/FAD-dependent oxidoreductase, partial [Candidatus Aerophobetes bacterium]
MFDVVVVGAGPVGCFTAGRLAEEGLKVALLEEDEEVGRDVICTGIIGSAAFQTFPLPQEAVLSPIKSILFFSPSLYTFQYTSPENMAYVVDRSIFDKGMLRYAEEKRVEVRLAAPVEKTKLGQNSMEVVAKEGSLNTRALVLATGIGYRLHKDLGLATPHIFLQGAQTEIEMRGLRETEIYLGKDIAPGSFAWAVPVSGSKARVGVLTRNKARFYLERFLEGPLRQRVEKGSKIRQKPIAYGPAARSVNDRVLAVGEAAGQVKTTTGGGIFYGLICSEIAIQVLKKAFHKGDLSYRQLSEY